MLFCFSILTGFLLNLLFGKAKLLKLSESFMETSYCVPFILLSLPLLFYLNRVSVPLGFLFHALLSLLTFRTGQTFLYSSEAKDSTASTSKAFNGSSSEKEDQNLLRKTLECISCFYIDRSAAIIFGMLIGGAPFAMFINFVLAKQNSSGFIVRAIRFFPARLGAFFFIVVAGMMRYDFNNGRRIYQRDRKNHSDTDAGQVLSACAGSLHIVFRGRAGLTIGNVDRPVTHSDITRMNDLCLYGSCFMILVGCFIRMLLLS